MEEAKPLLSNDNGKLGAAKEGMEAWGQSQESRDGGCL